MPADNDAIRDWAMDWREYAGRFLAETGSYLRFRVIKGRTNCFRDNEVIRSNVRRAYLRLKVSAPVLAGWMRNLNGSPEVFINALADMEAALDRLQTKEGPDIARLKRAYNTSVMAAEMIIESLPKKTPKTQSKSKRATVPRIKRGEAKDHVRMVIEGMIEIRRMGHNQLAAQSQEEIIKKCQPVSRSKFFVLKRTDEEIQDLLREYKAANMGSPTRHDYSNRNVH
jgi:hypothetical protein